MAASVDPRGETGTEEARVERLVAQIIAAGRFDLKFRLDTVAAAGVTAEAVGSEGGGQGATSVAPPSASSVQVSAASRISGEFTGADTGLLTARNGELLHAIEHISAKVLGLESEEHDRISFDAEAYKVNRDRALRELADRAIATVRATGRPYAFAAMNSRERRLLHMALANCGLPTASSGEMPRRFVVLYPEGYEVAGPAPSNEVPVLHRTEAIRNSFRRRV